jgi:hypothetical protein
MCPHRSGTGRGGGEYSWRLISGARREEVKANKKLDSGVGLGQGLERCWHWQQGLRGHTINTFCVQRPPGCPMLVQSLCSCLLEC